MRSRWLVFLTAFVCVMVLSLRVGTADEVAKATASEAIHSESEEHDHEGHGHEGNDHGGHGHDAGAHTESTPDPLTFGPDLALWTLGTFLLMAFLLKSTAWKPIMEGLKAREEGITGNIAAAEAKHDEAKALLAEHQEKLAHTADEVKALLDEARRDAEQTKTAILAEAKAAATTERERVVRDIDQARDVAVRQLAESSAGLAIDLAAKVVRQDLTAGRQSEIVKEALSRFAGTDPSSN